MAWGARSGLKPRERMANVCTLSRLNGLGSPFGIETPEFLSHIVCSFLAKWPGGPFGIETPRLSEYRTSSRWLNGLGSPFGIETTRVTTVALVEEEEEASPPGSANQKAAMAGELAKPLRPAPTPQSLALASEPAAESSRGCGYVDA